MVGQMATSSKRSYATHCMTQVCCSQSSFPQGRPLLTHASTEDSQTLKGRSGSVYVSSLGSGACKALFEPSKHLWWVGGLILNMILPLLPSYWGFSFALDMGYLFWWDPTFSCWWTTNGCSAVSWNFGILSGEDELTSFYSTILLNATANGDHSPEIKRHFILGRKLWPT